MTEQKDSQVESAAPSAPGQGEKDSVSQFLDIVSQLIPPDKAKIYVRITPHGLFVQKEFLPQVIQSYQKWFREKTGQTAELSSQKVLKRFFTTPKPPLYYLVEAKQCMVGHLIKREVAQPQLLKLPVYLGSVDDTRRIFHPRDPILLCMPHVECIHGRHGQEFKISTQRGEWVFSEEVLREFSRLLQRTPRLARQFAESTGSVRDAFKALVSVLEKANLVKETQRLLVPHRYRDKKVDFLCFGSLTFSIEGKNRLTNCYEVGARAIFRFIKSEFAALHSNPSERARGSIEIFSPRNRLLASFLSRERKIFIHPQGFGEFVRGIMHQAPERSNMPQKYSVRDCLHELASILPGCRPIERKKIERQVPHIRARNGIFLINERWIFFLNRKNVIISCIDRFHKSR